MLQQYITEVLFKQQTCSLPQVGTFTIQHIPAHFSVVEQVLTPPRQQVSFETRWEDDGSCLHWISQKENLIESVASLKLEKYLQEFREMLQSGQPVDLPGIGSLRLDPLGQVRFTAQELPDAWQPLELAPVLRSDASPKVLQGTTEVVNHEVVEHTEAVLEDEPRGRFRWWWVALPLAVIGIGLAAWIFRDQIMPPAPASKAPEQAVTTPVQDSIPAAAETVPPVNDSISYYVVFEKFPSKEKAEKKLAQRIAWGHSEVVLFASGDSAVYHLAVPFRSLPADTTAAKDSVAEKFKMPVYIAH
jgi:nucleoid DNA-binding protein